MDLLVLVVVAVLIGFITWTLTSQVPLPPGWAKAIQLVTLVILLLWLLGHFVRLPNVLPVPR